MARSVALLRHTSIMAAMFALVLAIDSRELPKYIGKSQQLLRWCIYGIVGIPLQIATIELVCWVSEGIWLWRH